MILIRSWMGVFFFRWIVILSSLMTTSSAYQICPGTGLLSKDGTVQIVIFEHTEMGTGGLVLNCPTPLNMGHLLIPRFQPFKECPLMLGCGIGGNDDDDNEQDDDTSTIPLGEVSPWFWLHNLDNIPGSYCLDGASGALYMGGNIEEASKRLQVEQINPLGRFKFFRKFKTWHPGKLAQELDRGEWKASQQDPAKALEAVLPSIQLP